MKTIRVTIILETKRGSSNWISEEVDAIPLTQHFCLAIDRGLRVTKTFTHIPSGWRIGDHFHWRKKEALPKAEALEKLDISWDSVDTNYYGSLPKDTIAEIRAIMAGMSIG